MPFCQLSWFGSAPSPQKADRICLNKVRGLPVGEFRTNSTPGLERFQWTTPMTRRFAVENVGLCKMRLTFEPDVAGRLLWTETYYSGWQLWLGGQPAKREKQEPCFSAIEIPAAVRELLLRYRPTCWPLGLAFSLVEVFGLAVLGVIGRGRSRTALADVFNGLPVP